MTLYQPVHGAPDDADVPEFIKAGHQLRTIYLPTLIADLERELGGVPEVSCVRGLDDVLVTEAQLNSLRDAGCQIRYKSGQLTSAPDPDLAGMVVAKYLLDVRHDVPEGYVQEAAEAVTKAVAEKLPKYAASLKEAGLALGAKR